MLSNLDAICQKTLKIVEEVAEFIDQELGRVEQAAIEIKGLNSLVSYVDKTAEQMLVKQLGELVPEATFITEEDTVENKKSALVWIIDPLDGTTNFLYQLPFFSVSVALYQDEKPIIGVVYEVKRKECFYAYGSAGAFLNDQPIKVSPRENLSDALIATGFPYDSFHSVSAYFNVLEQLMKQTRGIRRFGSAALDLAYVACGRFDAFFEYGLSPWDVAAGAFIVQAAGGKVTDFKGEESFLFGKQLIASSSHHHEKIQSLILSAWQPS